MKYVLVILFLLLGTVCAEAQLDIKVEKRVRLEAPTGYQVYVWNWPPTLQAEQRGSVLLVEGPAGSYRVNLVALNANIVDGQIEFDQQSGFVDVTIGSSPGPDPEPNPDPEPEPSTAPFDAPGLTVLVVYEYQDVADYPAGQQIILGNGETRKWLKEITEGRSRYDDDDTEWGNNPTPYLYDGFKVAKAKFSGKPIVAISNGKTGIVTELPETTEEFKTLVQRYK